MVAGPESPLTQQISGEWLAVRWILLVQFYLAFAELKSYFQIQVSSFFITQAGKAMRHHQEYPLPPPPYLHLPFLLSQVSFSPNLHHPILLFPDI